MKATACGLDCVDNSSAVAAIVFFNKIDAEGFELHR
jgi:hypothetical protein